MASRLFIVDDEKGLRSLYRRVLQGAGFQVVGEGEASSTLLDEILECHPDLVILDLTMPGGSGLDYVRDLTKEGIVVLVVSGGAEGPWRRQSIELGAAEALTKPVGIAQLSAAVRRALEVH